MKIFGYIFLVLISIYAGITLLNGQVLRDPVNRPLWFISLFVLIAFLGLTLFLIIKKKKFICLIGIVTVIVLPLLFDLYAGNFETALGYCKNYNSLDWSSKEFIECRKSMSWFDGIKFGYTNEPKR